MNSNFQEVNFMDSCDSTGRSRKYGANRTGKNVQLCVKNPLGIIK